MSSPANFQIDEVCICFNGKLLRANTTRKVDSIKFDSYASLVEPFAFKDIEVFVNTAEEVLPRLFFGKTSFGRSLSDELALIPVKGYVCPAVLSQTFKSSFFKAIIFDFISGVDLSLESTRSVLRLAEEETNKPKPKLVAILLAREIKKFSRKCREVLERLDRAGVYIIVGMTASALVQKISMILGSAIEFTSHQLVRLALSRNIARENSSLIQTIRRRGEVELYRLADKISRELANLSAAEQKLRLFEIENNLIQGERKNLIFWFKQFGMTFTTTTPSNSCALHSAIWEKKIEFIRFLLDCGCDFDHEDFCCGNGMFIALRSNRKDVVELFRKYKIDPKARPVVIYEFLAE